MEKHSQEFAEQEFERWAEEMDLDLDTDFMDDDDRRAFERQKKRVVKAIMNGSLTINDAGLATYTPTKSGDMDPITFYPRTGATIMAMDGKKKNQDGSKMYAMLGDITRQPPKTLARMVGIDVKVCEALFTFLMD